MLNTSLHNPNVKDKPSVQRFTAMNRGINDGGDLPEDLLRVRWPDSIPEASSERACVGGGNKHAHYYSFAVCVELVRQHQERAL